MATVTLRQPVAYEGSEPFIFISYSHKDMDRVYAVIRQLESDGFRVWFDDGIHASEDYAKKIANRILESSYFISFISENFLRSEWCLDELSFAKDEKQPHERFLIYLEPTDLPAELKLSHGRIQNLKMWELGARFYQKLYATENFDSCKVQKEVKSVSDDAKSSSVVDESSSSPSPASGISDQSSNPLKMNPQEHFSDIDQSAKTSDSQAINPGTTSKPGLLKSKKSKKTAQEKDKSARRDGLKKFGLWSASILLSIFGLIMLGVIPKGENLYADLAGYVYLIVAFLICPWTESMLYNLEILPKYSTWKKRIVVTLCVLWVFPILLIFII